MASGLLPVCFGDATKFAQALLDSDKEYVATVRFGIATTTGDAEGTETERGRDDFTRGELERALPAFAGTIAQVPPRHAALKYRGRNYYEYAREGIEIPRASRSVDVHAIELVDWAPPDAVLRVACSKGTYIRVLAEDIGRALGSCAHLVALRRVATGPFALAAAVTLDALETMAPEARDARLLPLIRCVAAMPRQDVSDERGALASPGTARGGCRSGRAREVSLLRTEFRVPGHRRMLGGRAAGGAAAANRCRRLIRRSSTV